MRQASHCLHRVIPIHILVVRSEGRIFGRNHFQHPRAPLQQQLRQGLPSRSLSSSLWKRLGSKQQPPKAEQDSERSQPSSEDSQEPDEQNPDKQQADKKEAVEAFYSPWVARIQKLLDSFSVSLFSRRTGTVSEKTEEAEEQLQEAAKGDSPAWPPIQLRQQAQALLESLTALTKQGREVAKEDAQPSTSQNDNNPEAVQAALRNGSLGFGFSAGGMLFPYYIGLVKELDRLGIITRDTPLAGSSAGSLIAACYHSGMPMDTVAEECMKLSEDCRKNGTRGRLRFVLQRYLVDLLPEDLHERCSGRAFVAVTHALPRPRPELISSFRSRDDCIAALLTSCHIPFYFDNSMMTMFRGGLCYDGGLTSFIPLPPTQHAVRVCCFPGKQMSRVYQIGISPDTFSEWATPMSQMLSWAFEPADEEQLRAFIARGEADANAWAHAMGVADFGARSSQADDGYRIQGEKEMAVAPAAVTGS